MRKLSVLIVAAALTVFMTACTSEGNFTGREYMPDMAHSIAYEANHDTYYENNQWTSEEDYMAWINPEKRKPVTGTIPVGYNVYHYGNTEAERERASAEITENPVMVTSAGMAKGKVLYNTYCGICHGEKGDGNGTLYDDGNGPYPAAPSNYLTSEYKEASAGRFYHVIMHGKNLMGSYKDKLNEEERWLVIHYIRSLQAKDSGTDYMKDLTAKYFEGLDYQESTLDKDFEAALAQAKKSGASKAQVIKNVFYESGSASLKKPSRIELNKLAALLDQNPSVKIRLNGHTDNEGEDALNMVLSNDRAGNVYDYLLDQGINPNQIVFKGYGASMPIADNTTEEGKKQNRRTEFQVIAF